MAAGAGTAVNVSPRAAMLFSREGEAARSLEFFAQLVDSLGVAIAPPAAGIEWVVSEPVGGLQLGPTEVSADGLTSRATVRIGRAGRDSLLARSGPITGNAVVTNWEWVAGSLSGPNWTTPGGAGCLEVSRRDSKGSRVGYGSFDHVSALSLDSEVATADSLVFATDSASARLCITGRSVGKARVGVSAWDSTSFKYFGEYARYHVLEPPLSVGMATRWEMGIGQSHPLSLSITDNRGTTLPLDPDWIDSWEVSDGSVLAVEDGVLTASAGGSGELRVTYLGQEVRADIEVYGIVEGRFNSDVMCVLTDRDTVRCWGDRRRPLWGYGRSTRGFVGPREVADLPIGGPVAQLTKGAGHECARMTAGDVRCWGRATGGLLGYGDLNDIGDNETPAGVGPVPIGVSEPVVDIGGGDDFVCAVFQSGRVRCWGSNHAGQLGMGHQRQINVGDDETPEDMASDVLLGGRAVQVAGGRYKACALLDNGKVRCWGLNAEDWDWKAKKVVGRSFGLGYGAFGTTEPIGDDEPPSEAGDLELPGTAKKIAVGGYHMCALMDDSAVRCWGDGGQGNLGHGRGRDAIGDDETAAATIPLYFESPAVDIAAGYWHTCVLLENGAVRCWGDGNSAGQLGIPGTTRLGLRRHVTSVDPVRVGGPVARIFLYDDGTCAVMRAGGLRCWGYNGGILGYPFRENIGKEEHPASVGDIMLFPGPLTGATARDAAANHTARDVDEPMSVLVVPERSAEERRSPDAPWVGPLAGPDGVILGDSIPTGRGHSRSPGPEGTGSADPDQVGGAAED